MAIWQLNYLKLQYANLAKLASRTCQIMMLCLKPYIHGQSLGVAPHTVDMCKVPLAFDAKGLTFTDWLEGRGSFKNF